MAHKLAVRQTLSVAVVSGALAAWWWIGQVTDWSLTATIAGVVVIAVGTVALDRWVVR